MLEKIKHFAISFAATIIVSYFLFSLKLINITNGSSFLLPLIYGVVVWLFMNFFFLIFYLIFSKYKIAGSNFIGVLCGLMMGVWYVLIVEYFFSAILIYDIGYKYHGIIGFIVRCVAPLCSVIFNSPLWKKTFGYE